jgi:hypothetical protein
VSKLPRVQIGTPIVDDNGTLSVAFHRYLDTLATNVEAQIGSLQAAQAAQSAATAAGIAATAANAAAGVANTAAATANTAATAVTATTSLANSYVTGLTITATDAGASVTVAISAHSRVYGNGTTVAVSAGSITGLAYSSARWVYYDQSSRLGGAVTYAAATTLQGNGTAPDRHFVGTFTTPAALAAPVTGKTVLPPGGQLP